MATYPYMLVDAFTSRALAGNACAVFFDSDDMSDETMLAVAREMNLSESAFVRRSQRADVGARYFTPAEEIPLAGHPTIATLTALVASGRLPFEGGQKTLTLELPAGIIPIQLDGSDGTLERVTMTQPAPRFLRTYEPERVLPVFGLDAGDLLSGYPVQTVSTGTPQLMIPLRDQAALRRARIDHTAYQALRAGADFFSPHLFVLGGVTPEGGSFARHFSTPPDAVEDPVTGSATGAMAAYLWHHGLLDEPTFVAEQGHWMGRPGQVYVERLGPREEIHGVRIGGSAVVVARGELFLPGDD